MPMSTPLSYGNGPLYPYDLNKAKELLAQSDWAHGFEITLYTIAGNADDVAKATALQQMWAPLGVRLKVEQMESATRLAHYNAADFQMLTSLWTNDINDPERDHLVVLLLPHHPESPLGLGRPGDRPAVPG